MSRDARGDDAGQGLASDRVGIFLRNRQAFPSRPKTKPLLKTRRPSRTRCPATRFMRPFLAIALKLNRAFDSSATFGIWEVGGAGKAGRVQARTMVREARRGVQYSVARLTLSSNRGTERSERRRHLLSVPRDDVTILTILGIVLLRAAGVQSPAALVMKRQPTRGLPAGRHPLVHVFRRHGRGRREDLIRHNAAHLDVVCGANGVHPDQVAHLQRGSCHGTGLDGLAGFEFRSCHRRRCPFRVPPR